MLPDYLLQEYTLDHISVLENLPQIKAAPSVQKIPVVQSTIIDVISFHLFHHASLVRTHCICNTQHLILSPLLSLHFLFLVIKRNYMLTLQQFFCNILPIVKNARNLLFPNIAISNFIWIQNSYYRRISENRIKEFLVKI